MSQNKTQICNIAEDFTREIRYVLIYNATDFTFNQNFRGLTPLEDAYVLKIMIQNPAHYSRKIDIKSQHNNDYNDIKIDIPIYDLSKDNKQKLIDFHKKRKYVVVLVSAQETMVLGNHREPLTLSFDDNIKDDGSGKDMFNLQITGQTIVFPKIGKITEKFRVLLFLLPLK